MQRSALCRSRRELSNAYFLAKFCLDAAENEPCQVCPTELGQMNSFAAQATSAGPRADGPLRTAVRSLFSHIRESLFFPTEFRRIPANFCEIQKMLSESSTPLSQPNEHLTSFCESICCSCRSHRSGAEVPTGTATRTSARRTGAGRWGAAREPGVAAINLRFSLEK